MIFEGAGMAELQDLVEVATGLKLGLGLGLGLLVIRVLAMAIQQWNVKEDRIDKGTKTLIEQLTAEVTRLAERLGIVERDLEECKKHRDELAEERAQLRGFLTGQGDAKQLAAVIVATEKVADRADGKGKA